MKPTREIDGSVPWNAPPLLLWHCRHLDKSPRVASMLESRSLSDGYYCQTQTWDRFHRLRTPLTSSNVANVIKCRHLHHVAGIILSPTLMNVLHKMDERRKIRLQADKYARRSNHSPIMTANKVTTSTRDATELVYRYYSHHPPPQYCTATRGFTTVTCVRRQCVKQPGPEIMDSGSLPQWQKKPRRRSGKGN